MLIFLSFDLHSYKKVFGRPIRFVYFPNLCTPKFILILEGIGSYENQNLPVLLMRDSRIKSISTGQDHSVVVKENGEVW